MKKEKRTRLYIGGIIGRSFKLFKCTEVRCIWTSGNWLYWSGGIDYDMLYCLV